MARSSLGMFGEKGGMARGVSVSTRSSELDAPTKRMVKKQNKAAESYKIKDMDKLDKNRADYIKRKQAQLDKLKAEIAAAKKQGRKQGAAATVVVVGAGAAYKKKSDKKKK